MAALGTDRAFYTDCLMADAVENDVLELVILPGRNASSRVRQTIDCGVDAGPFGEPDSLTYTYSNDSPKVIQLFDWDSGVPIATLNPHDQSHIDHVGQIGARVIDDRP